MSETIEEIAGAIKEFVATDGHVPGSRLAQTIKGRFPSFQVADHNVRNFREFISKYVPAVAVVKRSGMDVVYGIAVGNSANEVSSSASVGAQDFWRIWVSPNSPHALVINRETGDIRAAPRQASTGPTELLLQPPTTSDHLSIAREFLKLLPDDVRNRLAPLVDLPTQYWWHDWLKELRGTEHLSSWNDYRREHLEGLLRERIRALGLSPSVVDAVIQKVRKVHTVTSSRVTNRPVSKAMAMPQHLDTEEAIRHLVAVAVQKMSITELRELRLPLGAVLDALSTPKSR